MPPYRIPRRGKLFKVLFIIRHLGDRNPFAYILSNGIVNTIDDIVIVVNGLIPIFNIIVDSIMVIHGHEVFCSANQNGVIPSTILFQIQGDCGQGTYNFAHIFARKHNQGDCQKFGIVFAIAENIQLVKGLRFFRKTESGYHFFFGLLFRLVNGFTVLDQVTDAVKRQMRQNVDVDMIKILQVYETIQRNFLFRRSPIQFVDKVAVGIEPCITIIQINFFQGVFSFIVIYFCGEMGPCLLQIFIHSIKGHFGSFYKRPLLRLPGNSSSCRRGVRTRFKLATCRENSSYDK